jgi:DNA/RNA endonuclease G (NUC1)/uncharacterized protein YjdB
MSLKSFARRGPTVWFAALVVAGACTAGVDRLTGPSLSPAGPALVVGTTSSPAGLVISQVYGGGGNSGATLKSDFIELYNGSANSIDVSGMSVQYSSATSASWATTALSGTIASGHYYLVKEADGANATATPLTAPDLIGTIALGATAGKVALVNGLSALSGACPAGAIDFVGFGSTASCFEGHAPTGNPANATAVSRNVTNTDSNDNANDFTVGAPNPRNSSVGGAVVVGPLDHVVVGGLASVAPGATIQLTAIGQDAANQSVAGQTTTWESSNAAIATVDAAGKVTGVMTSADSVVITATVTADGITRAGTKGVRVPLPAAAATVLVTPATWSLKAGATKQLVATAADSNGVAVTTTYTWTSADATIATVDAAGLVTGKKIGATTVTATSANGKSKSSAITVTSGANVLLNSGKVSFALGMQTQFFYGGTDASGAAITSVVWSTSDSSVITVDQKGVVTGRSVGTANLIATAPDGSTGSRSISIYLAAGATTALRLGHNLEFGEPKDADPSNDFIIRRPQYAVSYNAARGGANWVSWNLDKTHVGTNGRCVGTCYSADTALTNAGITAYTTADWVSGNTYDRGHMAPSADWTSSEADNNTTFFLTNFVPQTHDMNAGPWERLENALRDSVAGGREAYIIAGGVFKDGVGLGTVLNLGKIAIPNSTWKIAVITPAGTGINPDGTLPPNTTVMAVDMPNVHGIINDGFEKYLTTVDKIQQETGYDFLALLADNVECRVEVRNCAPSAHISGAGLAGGNEGQTLSFSGATSTDPDVGDVISYAWTVNGVAAGNQATLSHTFTNNGSYTLRLIAADDKGASDTVSATVAIANVAPTVAAIAPATVAEGSTYAATGTFSDPGLDSWSAVVDYGDNSGPQTIAAGAGAFTLGHVYADNGTYTVTVTVKDNDGGSGSATGTVTVTNVAPTVSPLASVTLLRGETYAAAGTFTDPGSDTWSATVNYGEGAVASLPLAGKTFSLQHTYTSTGVKTLTVIVTDDDNGVGSQTVQVTVLTGTQSIGVLASSVAALASAGRMDDKDAKWIANKLDIAAKEIARGNLQPTLNQLSEIARRIDSTQSSGTLSAADAASLTAYLNRIVVSIS